MEPACWRGSTWSGENRLHACSCLNPPNGFSFLFFPFPAGRKFDWLIPVSDFCQQLVLERGLRHHPDDLVDQLAALEKQHGGDGADAILRGDRVVLVDVQLRDGDLAIELARELFEDRSDGLARSSPGSPEVDEDRRGGTRNRALERVSGEVGDFGGHRFMELREAGPEKKQARGASGHVLNSDFHHEGTVAQSRPGSEQ